MFSIGIDVNAQDESGNSALHVAQQALELSVSFLIILSLVVQYCPILMILEYHRLFYDSDCI